MLRSEVFKHALSANALLAIVSNEMHIKTPCILHMNQATAALSLETL